MRPSRRAFVLLSLALAAPAAALAAVPPAAPAEVGAPAPPATGERDRFVQDADYVNAVERQAQQRGVRVQWVNPPERREARTRTLRLRGTLPARESCHGRGCPERADD